MIYPTFFVRTPGLLCFRFHGWGLILWSTTVPVLQEKDHSLLAVPVWPGWRFAWLAPWL